MLYQKRPPVIQELINMRFEALSRQPVSIWTYNGDVDDLNIAGFSTLFVITALIEERLKRGQRVFFFLDAGAGLFGWGRQLAVLLIDKFQKPEYLTKYGQLSFNIVSVSGEKHGEVCEVVDDNPISKLKTQHANTIIQKRNEIIQSKLTEDPTKHTATTRVLSGRGCHLYEFGGFRLENICEDLPLRFKECCPKHSPVNSVIGHFDYIMSNSTLQHLVDPIATMEQLLNMLSMNGIAQVTGFRTTIQPCQKENTFDPSRALMYLLTTLNIPCFTGENFEHNPTLLLQRVNTEPLEFTIVYDEKNLAEQINDHERALQYQFSISGNPVDFKYVPIQCSSGEPGVYAKAGLLFYLALHRLMPPREVDNDLSSMWVTFYQNSQKTLKETWCKNFGPQILEGPFPLLIESVPPEQVKRCI